MVEFKKKFSMQNGNKVTKKNWNKVFAISTEPDNHHHGYPEIERIQNENGVYFNKWKLVFEKNDEDTGRTGFIFREIFTNTGINGHHKTFKQAIWWAIQKHIHVYLED